MGMVKSKIIFGSDKVNNIYGSEYGEHIWYGEGGIK
jgi:hypothetical protein